MATSQRASLLPGAENHRHGRVSGDDGLTKIVRTFHARFGSVKLGGSVTARERLAYVHREGKHAGDAADVEATAGDKEKVIEASDRIRDTARVRRGKTAERLLATQVIELPMESTAEQRRTCADAFVADWRGRGHQAVAVVHVHGEEHKQPHLHVEIAARPVDADGSVNRSATRLWAGGHPAVEVKKERARAADIVNRTCDPDPPYHPGGFRDIGVERQPRTRIPAGKFREAREEIRDARAAGLREGLIEATAYAVSDKERGKKREARVGRTAEIIEFRAAGLPARPSQRARLAFAEPALKAERERADKAEGSLARRDDAARDKAEQEKIAAGQALADERARAEKAEASAATLTDEKQKAEGERDGLQDRVRVLEELNKRQTKYVTNWHANRKVVLPDLATVEGQSAAWANMWAWDARALKKARDEAGAAVTAATTAEKERDEQRERAEKAEDRVPALEQKAGDADVLVRELEARSGRSPSRSPKGSARCSWASAPASTSRAIPSTTPGCSCWPSPRATRSGTRRGRNGSAARRRPSWSWRPNSRSKTATAEEAGGGGGAEQPGGSSSRSPGEAGGCVRRGGAEEERRGGAHARSAREPRPRSCAEGGPHAVDGRPLGRRCDKRHPQPPHARPARSWNPESEEAVAKDRDDARRRWRKEAAALGIELESAPDAIEHASGIAGADGEGRYGGSSTFHADRLSGLGLRDVRDARETQLLVRPPERRAWLSFLRSGVAAIVFRRFGRRAGEVEEGAGARRPARAIRTRIPMPRTWRRPVLTNLSSPSR